VNYYNENDPKAAAWLRNLIGAGLIPAGHVDERSITDVRGGDLAGFTQCHFFAGIGGWSHALRLAGWPDDRPVWTGSPPCQPFSDAGKGLGEKDPRHLWPWFRELIAQRGPAVFFGEQVASKKGRRWFAGVRADLEKLGYAVGGGDLCSACAGPEAQGWIVRGRAGAWERITNGAPNIRQRLYWMADATRGAFGIDGRASGQAGHVDKRGPVGGLAVAQGEGWAGVESERKTGIGVGARAGGYCAAGGLADPDGRGAGDGRIQSGGQHGFKPSHAGAGGLGDPSGARGRGNTGTVSGAQGESEGQGGRARRIADESFAAGSTIGLGYAEQPRLQGFAGDGDHGDQPGRQHAAAAGSAAQASGAGGFWGAFNLVHCTDGKARRIEPGSFPLAAGVPGRVGLLRGYGNAINVQLAAEWITVCSEALSEGY